MIFMFLQDKSVVLKPFLSLEQWDEMFYKGTSQFACSLSFTRCCETMKIDELSCEKGSIKVIIHLQTSFHPIHIFHAIRHYCVVGAMQCDTIGPKYLWSRIHIFITTGSNHFSLYQRLNFKELSSQIVGSRNLNMISKCLWPFCVTKGFLKVPALPKNEKWYFVTKIVLTYCEKKLF